MKTFEDLYYEILIRTMKEKNEGFLSKLEMPDTHQLDCLLNPEKYPVVVQTGPCSCGKDDHDCVNACHFHAITPGEAGEIHIDETLCTGCELCVQECRARVLAASKDVMPVLRSIRAGKGLVYALIAPAYIGQFSSDVTPGKLRKALKKSASTA